MSSPGIPVLTHLKLTEEGGRRLHDVFHFLDELDARSHPLAARARRELVTNLLDLDGYGGFVSDSDRRRFEVTLGADLYPLSFTITWKQLGWDGAYAMSMTGALVWHGGPGDPGSVSLEADVLWQVHT